jgi:hypothetical protein
LDELPADGRAFALAVAAEELLRASWAELALREAPPEVKAAPPQVKNIVRDSLTDSPAQADREAMAQRMVAARLAFEHYLAGQTHVGADLAVRQRLARRFQVEATLGGRTALQEKSASGSVSGYALSASAAMLFGFIAEPGLHLFAESGVRGARVWFRGEPTAMGAQGQSFSGWAVFGRGGLGAEVGSSGLSAGLRLGLGAPISTLEARDGDETVTGVGKLELYATTQVGVEF